METIYKQINHCNGANIVDKYTICVKKNDDIEEHLLHGRNGRFAKMIFYFLKADK